MITATGWTRETVDQMTLPEVNELMAYWKDEPPAHVMIGAYVKARASATGSRSRTPGRRGKSNMPPPPATQRTAESLPEPPSKTPVSETENLPSLIQAFGGKTAGKLPKVYQNA